MQSPECVTNVTFDYNGSPYFALAGTVTEPFEPKTIEFFGVSDIISMESLRNVLLSGTSDLVHTLSQIYPRQNIAHIYLSGTWPTS